VSYLSNQLLHHPRPPRLIHIACLIVAPAPFRQPALHTTPAQP